MQKIFRASKYRKQSQKLSEKKNIINNQESDKADFSTTSLETRTSRVEKQNKTGLWMEISVPRRICIQMWRWNKGIFQI